MTAAAAGTAVLKSENLACLFALLHLTRRAESIDSSLCTIATMISATLARMKGEEICAMRSRKSLSKEGSYVSENRLP